MMAGFAESNASLRMRAGAVMSPQEQRRKRWPRDASAAAHGAPVLVGSTIGGPMPLQASVPAAPLVPPAPPVPEPPAAPAAPPSGGESRLMSRWQLATARLRSSAPARRPLSLTLSPLRGARGPD